MRRSHDHRHSLAAWGGNSGGVSTLLVAPPYQRQIASVAQTTIGAPMGLAYLAGALRDAGLPVTLLDANALGLGPEEVARRIVATAPSVLGLTATTPTIDLCADIVRRAKESGYRGRVMVGGPHPSALPLQTLERYPGFDVAVVGEAEGRIIELVTLLHSRVAPEGVPGVAWRGSDGPTGDPQLPEPPDLDLLPLPARDLLPMHRYRSPDSLRAHTVVATRGCPAPCTYCGVPGFFGQRVRRRDPEEVAEELGDLARRWRADHINFVDDTFTWDADWVLDLCSALEERGLHRRLTWQCLTRVDRVDRVLLGRMAQAGCRRVEMGIECASPDGLKALAKGIAPEQVTRAFSMARAAGLETMALAMVNAPGESSADIDDTWRLVQRIDPDQLQVAICTPYPGTKLYDEARRDDTLRTDDFYRFRFLREAVLDNGVMTAEEAIAAQRRLQRRFWLRPRTVARLAARGLREPSTGVAIARTALSVVPALVRRR